MNWDLVAYQQPHLKNFQISQIEIQSTALKSNPLKDPHLRYNPILIPKKLEKNKTYPLVVVLAGFGGNGPNYFSLKSFQKNQIQVLDDCFTAGTAPKAFYLYVDAWTFWGGSQFKNSEAVGKYEDYIVNELLQNTLKELPIDKKKVCITGGSSGGYGALHLSSKYPEIFPVCAAIAPDCFFEASMIPDIYKASSFLASNNSLKTLKDLHMKSKIASRRDGFTILNAICMSTCYSPKGKSGDFHLPIDLKTGLIKEDIWKKWKENDPILFLNKRISSVKKLKNIYIDVGNRDQYNLHFGARQIHEILKKAKVKHKYVEFDGGHFDISERRPEVYLWLKKIWKV